MPFINWTENYNTGILQIDNQHLKLVSLINDLHEAMKAGKAKEVVVPILRELTDYTVTHFSLEEKYMTQYKYAAYLTHKQKHGEFVSRVQEFQKKIENVQSSASIEILKFLKDWLLNHILVSDKQYVPFFQEKGIK